MSKTIRLLTEWNTDAGNQMRVALEHAGAFTDVTGQADAAIPKLDINALIVEVTEADDKLLADLEADPNVTILWTEDSETRQSTKEDSTTKQRRDAVKKFLTDKVDAKDKAVKDAEIEQRIKDAGKAGNLEAAVKEYLKSQPATKEDDGGKLEEKVK